MNKKIVVRAFNKEGFHKDILIMCEKQVRLHNIRITKPTDSFYSNLIGHGGRIDPKDFPEVEYFEIVVTDW